MTKINLTCQLLKNERVRNMKKLLFTLAVLFIAFAGYNVSFAQTEPVKIDAEHFSDDTFRANMSGYDTDKDGCLSEQEISAITSLNYDGGDNGAWKEVASLKGIEYLTALENLSLSFNKITDLDLSHNTKLKSISINNMPLHDINLKSNAELEKIDASGLELGALDLTGNEKLQYFNLTNSKTIENIEFGNKPLLKTISCEDSGLKKLALSNMPELEKLNVSDTKISKLDVSALKKLRILYCSGKSFRKLTLCNNKNLKVVLRVSAKLKTGWKNIGKKAVLKSSKKNILKIGSNGNITALKAGKTKLSCGKNKCIVKVQK